jgi:hypothetical protein
VAVVTERFEDQGNFVARAAGMPDIPRVVVPHPVAGRDAEYMAALADRFAPVVLAQLQVSP